MVAAPIAADGQAVVGILTSLTGRVTVVRPASAAVPLKARDTISVGDLVATDAHSTAEFLSLGGVATVVKLRERTTLNVVDQTPRRTILSLAEGAVAVAGAIAWQADLRDTFEVRTRGVVAQSRGAAFWVETDGTLTTRVCVFSGTAVANTPNDPDGQRVRVGPRQCVMVGAAGIGAPEPLPESTPDPH